mmetsp:Transcript_35400/g.47813  ORF Transcript_35400/g.47813 Transcript_35400/m.47813 type:complete len:92 (+) Transcript_35400:757-1032(+)
MKKHPVFKRVGDNLYMDMEIKLEEALLGFKRVVKHLDGHQVTVESKENQIIQPFEWIIIEGEGMPKRGYPSEYGDLHVKMIVQFPKQVWPG